MYTPLPSESITLLAFTSLLLPPCLSGFVVRSGRFLQRERHMGLWAHVLRLPSRAIHGSSRLRFRLDPDSTQLDRVTKNVTRN